MDLSQILSKYIGETESNLEQVFSDAQRGGSVLLFDEADAIFSKRTEVKNNQDRHGNQLQGFLLQKIEAYSGIAILTSNFADAIDEAFVRRLRHIIPFALPGLAERMVLWQHVFPQPLPKAELDYPKLAAYRLSGAEIKNVALSGAFAAARDNQILDMPHLINGIIQEFDKNQRPVTKD